jgi:hypothetical protein
MIGDTGLGPVNKRRLAIGELGYFSPAVALGKLASEPNGFVNKSTKANVALHWWRQLPLMFAML